MQGDVMVNQVGHLDGKELSRPLLRPLLKTSSFLLFSILVALLLAVPAQAGIDTICYAVSDGGGANGGSNVNDNLLTMDKTTGVSVSVGATGTQDIESIAFNYVTDELFAANGGQIGTIDVNTGTFTPLTNPVGDCRLSGGTTVNISDVDSLSFDPFNAILWASHRVDASDPVPTNDLLFQIDPVTGLIIPDVFGTDVDCVRVVEAVGTFLLLDLDDVAIDPTDGTLFAIDNDGGTNPDQLITIDKSTGEATLVGLVGVDDMEGLSFGNDGVLFGTTGNESPDPLDRDSMWTINKFTGAASGTPVGTFVSETDFESVGCLTADVNLISGTTFFDIDGNGSLIGGTGDDGVGGITVRLYRDENGDGLVDGGDTLIDTQVTNTNGEYEFTIALTGDFVLDIDTGTLPAGSTLTTDNVEVANFVGFGNIDTDNDFGFRSPNELTVTKTSDVIGDAVPGQTITYTIEVTNNTIVEHTGVTLFDSLPAGTTYVASSTDAVGPELTDAIRVTEYQVNADTGTTITVTLNQALAANYFTIVQGSDGNGTSTRGPDENYVAVTSDPFGTGDLGLSGAVDTLQLTRHNNQNGWTGIVTVVECLRSCDQTGFQLLDVQRVAHTGVTTSGTDTSTTAWSDINQIMLLGGFNGAGCDTPETSSNNTKVCHARLFPSGTDTINWTRDPNNATLSDATSTVMVLEWGSEWTVQREQVSGDRNGDGADSIDEYVQAFLDTKVARANTWVWGTGHAVQNGIGEAAEGATITLGNGVNQFATENQVSVGFEANSNGFDFEVYALSHPNLAVDYRFKPDGDQLSLTTNVTVDAAGPNRMALVYNTHHGTGGAYPRPMLSARYTSNTNVELARQRNGTMASTNNGQFTAWVQGIDFTNVRASSMANVTKDNDALSANALLNDGSPPNLVQAADSFGLATGETLTVTYQTTLDAPLDANTTRVLNLVLAESDQTDSPSSAQVVDPVSRGGALGDRVWLDTDGDGIQDVGEPGIANVTLTLFDVGGDGMIGGGDDVAIGTTVTGTDGTYLFDRLPPGTYYVDVTDADIPAGLTISAGSTDPSATRTITSEEIFLDLDFGYSNAAGTAIIGDKVWSDADSDGVLDPGEIGLENITVQLLSAGADGILGTGDDVVEDTTTTGPDGSYLFTGVAPGDYIVSVDGAQPNLTGYTFVSGPESVSNPSVPISVDAGDTYLDADFAFNNPSNFSISDTVWLDTDGNGLLDGGESGIENVTVNLLNAGGDVIATTITDANGDFSFTGLPDGDYTIEITDNQGELIGLGGTTTPGVDRSLAVMVAGADVTGTNFGYNGPGTIGDTVWSDADGDGILDAGELGIGGVTVELWQDANDDGVFDSTVDTLIGSTVTAADGTYLFDGLLFGTFFTSIDETQPALSGYTRTTADEEVGANAGGAQLEAPITNLDATFLEADYGYRNNALPDVSGNVFEDLDIDGLDDGAGEPGFPGVTIALVDSGGNVVAKTTTDSNGDYLFPDVPAGDYTVEVTDEDGVLDGYLLTSGLDQIPVTVVASDITDVDFGYVREAGTASIGDFVWLDANRDGIQGGAENGISGVTVNLYDPGPDGVVGGGDDVLLSSTTTDANGGYRFSGLEADNYYVEVDTSTLPSADLVATTPNPTTLINLSEGEFYDQADFGFGSDPTEGAIGNFVWYDADGDGLQDPGEVGIGGVTIEINGPGCAPCTTVTAADGSYLVTGLAPGTYIVTFDDTTLPAGFNTTATNAEDWTVELLAGETITSADFGFNGGTTGSIGDTVFLDNDGNGLQDVGEDGIGGVTLNLLDTMGNILATTTTDADGNYDFLGLQAGDYRVEVSDIDGVLDGLSLSTANNPTGTISLAAGQDFDDADFGYEPVLGSIGSLVWHDQNGDGDVDAGEPGLAQVTVDLWLDNNGNGVIEPGIDNLLRQTTTNLQGEYEFTGLLPGDYLVTISDDNNVLTGFTKTSGTAGVDDNSQADPYSVTLTTGSPDNLTADFGYFVNTSPLTISGTTFFDADSNGTLGGFGEFGVDQVDVLLFRDLDGDGVLDPEDALINSMESDGSGDYLFTNLPPGNYIVAVDATGSFLEGGIQTTQLATNNIQPVTLVATDSVDNDFGFSRRATVVLLSHFEAYELDGRTVIEWQTAAESNSVGFHVYRFDAAARTYEPLHQEILPSLLGAPQGGVYRFIDEDAAIGSTQTYVLAESQGWGLENFYGPYTVKVEPASDFRLKASLPEQGFDARPRNPRAAHFERLATHHSLRNDLRTKAIGDGDQVKLLVREDGLHQVDAASLAELFGLPTVRMQARLRSGRVHLSNQGREVSWMEIGKGDAILFYGEGTDSLFTRDNVYWLALDRGTEIEEERGSQSTPVSGESFSSTLHFEENLVPATTAPIPDGADFWLWKGLLAGHTTLGSQSFDLELADPAPSLALGEMTLTFQAVTSADRANDHRAEVSLNGEVLGETTWTAYTPHQATFNFDPTLLADGNNLVTVRAILEPGVTQSLFYVNSIDVTYERFYRAVDDQLRANTGFGDTITVDNLSHPNVLVFDITDPAQPSRLTSVKIDSASGAYRVTFRSPGPNRDLYIATLDRAREPVLVNEEPSDLRSSANAAEYLFLTTRTLRSAAEDLANYRRGQGFSVEVVDLEDVMDEFNHGLYDPAVLREFLAWTQTTWSVTPNDVLLVGDGHFDYRDNFGLGGNLIPPKMVSTPYGLFASDVWFTDTDGDLLPEINIGRLPALVPLDLVNYLIKVRAFEETAAGDWADRALFAADNSDDGGNFTRDSNAVSQLLPSNIELNRIYLDQSTVPAARQKLLDQISEGVGLINFVGHGGLDRFTAEGLLVGTDVPGLRNDVRLPVVASLTCTVGRFEVPGFEALAESLVLQSDGGAIAVWAPSGLSLNFEARKLNEALIQNLYQPGQRLGDTIQNVLETYDNVGIFEYMQQIYILMGEPVIQMK